MDIGSKLKALREAHNLKQDELSLKLNMSRSTITNYENGNRTPDIETLYKICDFYNVTLEEFFKEDDCKPKKNLNHLRIIKITIVSISIVVLLIILLVNLIIPKHQYGYDINNDELKVNNSSEIAIIKVLNKENTNTYHIQVIESLKGDQFEYILIKNKEITVNLSKYYLLFGNKVSSDTEKKNYISFNCMEIHDKAFIYELTDYDNNLNYLSQPSKSKTIIDYYSYYIDNAATENIITSKSLKSRDEEYVIDNKDIFKNKYDVFNLNEDFDIKFNDMIGSKYLIADIEISMRVKDINSSKQVVAIYNNASNDEKDLLVYYEFDLKDFSKTKYNEVTLNFKNINTKAFQLYENSELIVRYGTKSVFSSSWTNSNINIKIGYRIKV